LDISANAGSGVTLITLDQLGIALQQRAALLRKPILLPVDKTGNLPANDRIGPLALAQAKFHRLMLEDFRNPERLAAASTQVRKSRPMAQAITSIDPNDPTEKLICSIWSEVLGLETIGVHADFFENGGHSLAAIRVLTRVRDMFGVELPTTSIFENRDVASMAGLVKQMLLQQVHTMSEEDVRQSLV
jgi:acyl carrier protein